MGMCFGRRKNSRNNMDNMNQLKQNSGPIIFLVGAPNIGKRELGRRLSSKYGFIMISTGDLLKQEIQNGSERGQKFADMTKEGQSVSANDVVPMLEEQLMNQPNAVGFLIVGFPHDKAQATLFNKEVKRPSLVLHLQVKKDDLSERAKNAMAKDDKNSERLSKEINSYMSTISSTIRPNKKVTKEIDVQNRNKDEIFKAALEEIDKL
ncbi:adenylate kinase isoenzyme 1-like [Vespula squamosa]|uniref:Adenylate kinase isoenzyme 1-like n=1 Tax=Vespula squamosa TaxID=30214 RepID=A0ABD2C875_VESSQ